MALSRCVLGPILALFLLFASICGVEDQEFLGEGLSTLVVEHALNDDIIPEFTRRGTINVRSIKSGTAQYLHEGGVVEEPESEGIKDLVRANALYKIRIGSKPHGSDTMQYVTAFTKACSLYESGLRDLITINVDLSGNVIGASITTGNAVCVGTPSGRNTLEKFRTNVEIVQTVNGPAPDLQNYIKKIEVEKAEKQQGEMQDNRSFFAKYWMYLVPLFIFLMFASGSDPQGGGGR